MKKRYSEGLIVGSLKRQEAATTVGDLCRELEISAGNFYTGAVGGRSRAQRGEAPPRA